MKYEALKTVFHTSKDFIAPGKVFDSETVGISEESAKKLIDGGSIRSAAGDAAITYPAVAVTVAVASAPAPVNATALIALIATITDLARLDELSDGEKRVTVTAAIEKRRAELQTAIDLAGILERIEAAASAEELNALAEGETRAEVLQAIEAKHSVLAG